MSPDAFPLPQPPASLHGLEQLHESSLRRDDRHRFAREVEQPSSLVRDEVAAVPVGPSVDSEQLLEVPRDERARLSSAAWGLSLT